MAINLTQGRLRLISVMNTICIFSIEDILSTQATLDTTGFDWGNMCDGSYMAVPYRPEFKDTYKALLGQTVNLHMVCDGSDVLISNIIISHDHGFIMD